MLRKARMFEREFGVHFTPLQIAHLCIRWKCAQLRSAVRNYFWRRKAIRLAKHFGIQKVSRG